MNEEFLKYYANEMDFIRQMGAEFATAHPQVAGQLMLEASQCADPHVERLLEAFAFLTARIRKKIDDEYPEITDALLSVVYPHYQRPIPSMAVVEFVPSADATKMTVGHVVGRGVELTSPPVSGGSPCRFRSAFPVTLWPVAVESASLAPDRVAISGQPAGSVALLRLGLRCTAPGDWASLERFDSLRFFLHGGEPVPTSLYESLFNDLREVWVQGKVAGGAEKTVVLPRDSVEPVGFAPDEAILPYPDRSFPGYRLLQEYFAFPPKFLFFNLRNLELVRAAKFTGPVEVLFFLKQAPRTKVVIRPDNFRLGCSPVVNLFVMAAEPIRLDRLRTAYPIVPKYGELAGYEVFSVDKVVSVGSYLDGVVEFQPFYAMRHSATAARKNAYWFANRRPSLRDGDDGIEVEISFTDAEFSPTSPSVETITTHLTCTNRDIPSRLPFGGNDVVFQLESDAPVGQVRLLTRPTKTNRPPLGRSAQWAAIAHLGPNHLSLIDSARGPEALRELLTVYDFARTAVTRKMVEGVVEVSSRRVAGRTGNRMGNTLSLGVEVTIQFDEESYAGSGAFLMASILERFLGAYVTINSFTQMVATSKQREGTWKRWPPRCGDRTLL
jgi:type VI secretion system protein ImpG